jgi:hypothetical protein
MAVTLKEKNNPHKLGYGAPITIVIFPLITGTALPLWYPVILYVPYNYGTYVFVFA